MNVAAIGQFPNGSGFCAFRSGTITITTSDNSTIKMGIAGDKYFEVLSGLATGDQVITGPYNSVRGMADGDLVKVDNKAKK